MFSVIAVLAVGMMFLKGVRRTEADMEILFEKEMMYIYFYKKRGNYQQPTLR
jgi:hypothetical protein